jgi:phosphoglycolate phosphatase-like HAD superfamily hydrolase
VEGDTPHVSLVCCDLADIVVDSSVAERAFAEAIAAQGIVPGTQSYTRAMVKLDRGRGRPPAEIMNDVFEGNPAQAAVASFAFDQSFRDAIHRFGVAAPPAVAEVLKRLSRAGRKVCLLTALSRSAGGQLADGFCRDGLGDLALCADDTPRGFPWPDPVLTAIIRLGCGNVREVAIVGTTESCMESGRRAGAGMIVGLTDLADKVRATALRQAGATHVLDGLDSFPALVEIGP